jgi:hypothetical protein
MMQAYLIIDGSGSVFRLLIFVAVILGLYFFLNPPVSVVAELPSFPAQVEVIAKPGVSNYELQAVNRSIRLTAHMLEQEIGLQLHHPVKVMLVPDITAYYTVLMEELKLDGNSALYQAGISAGTTGGQQIVLNCGAVPNYNDLVFITAHEITHQYQFETAAEWTRNNWFIEGMAEVVAANIVAVNQGDRDIANDYRKTWEKQLRKAAPGLPELKQLDERKDWTEAFFQYNILTYRYGALAVYNLVDQCGFPSLAVYITARNRGMKAEDAFFRAFKQELPVFFQEQDRWLNENTKHKIDNAKAGTFIPAFLHTQKV